jgi:hypothetical protein
VTPTEMEALVRSIIVHHGFPFGAVSVIETPDGWQVVARTASGGNVAFAVPDSGAAAIRVAVKERLEAEL